MKIVTKKKMKVSTLLIRSRKALDPATIDLKFDDFLSSYANLNIFW